MFTKEITECESLPFSGLRLLILLISSIIQTEKPPCANNRWRDACRSSGEQSRELLFQMRMAEYSYFLWLILKMGNQSTCSCLSALILFFASPSLALSLSASSSLSFSALSLHTLLRVREEPAQKAEPRVRPVQCGAHHLKTVADIRVRNLR